jgi:hypothetical protein
MHGIISTDRFWGYGEVGESRRTVNPFLSGELVRFQLSPPIYKDMTMTHKIAIITTGYTSFDRYGDDYQRVVESITAWDEVTNEEFKALKAMEGKLGYTVIERPENFQLFVKKTVADYLAFVKTEEKRLTDRKAAREKAALDRKLKQQLKDEKSKKELYEKLKEEFELKNK